MARRARIFELYSQGLTPPAIQAIAAPEFEVTSRTVRDDLNKMNDWLPELVKMTASSDERASELLGLNRLIRQRLMNLAETSNHDPSRVGALKGSLDSVKNEMTFLQSLGKVEKVADKVQVDSGVLPLVVGLYDADSPSWEIVKKELQDKRKEKTENADL